MKKLFRLFLLGAVISVIVFSSISVFDIFFGDKMFVIKDRFFSSNEGRMPFPDDLSECETVSIPELIEKGAVFSDSLMLINSEYPLAENYAPALIDLNGNEVFINECAEKAYSGLKTAVTENCGDSLYIMSSFRTPDEQKEIKKAEGDYAADVYSSEHLTGLALDVYTARGNAVYGDALIGDRLGKRSRKGNDSALGHRVIDEVVKSVFTGNRADVYDASVAVFYHIRQHGVSGVHRSENIYINHLLPLGRGRLHEVSADIDSGVVYENMYLTEFAYGLADSRSDRGLVGYVEDYALDAYAVLHARLGGRAEGFLVDVCDNYRSASFCKALGYRSSYSVACSGYECYLAFKIHIILLAGRYGRLKHYIINLRYIQ